MSISSLIACPFFVLRENELKEHDFKKKQFIRMLHDELIDAILLSKESLSNGDERKGQRYAFQVAQLRFMLNQLV